ncbi:MAG: ATP-binding protein [Acidimicrobiales bacterium]
MKNAEQVDVPEPSNSMVEDDALVEGVYAEAVVEVTGEILHELEPLLGMLRVRLETEWSNFETSRSADDFDRVEMLMNGLRELNTVSRVPTLNAVELAELLSSIASEFGTGEQDAVATSGPELVVQSNNGLLGFIVRNALRNAFEASVVTDAMPVLTWGALGQEFFIAVLDSGVGPPAGVGRAFELGRSTKPGHLGMGLTVADRAAAALGGAASLRRRPEGGAVFEFRGPVSP